MRRAAAEQVKAVRGLIDPDNDESPLGRYRSEIVKSVREETAKVQKAVQELTTQLAVDEAQAEMFELTTKKGFTFEDELEAALIGICQPLGDVAERVGGTPGVRGKKGDFKVVLNPDDAAGQDVCFTLEAKNQQLNLRDTLQELDAAIANREALAGIAVFAKAEQCPGDAPFQSYGNRALVVYDPRDGDDAGAAARLLLGALGRAPAARGRRRHGRPRPGRLADRGRTPGAADTLDDRPGARRRRRTRSARRRSHLGHARRRGRGRSSPRSRTSSPRRRGKGVGHGRRRPNPHPGIERPRRIPQWSSC